MYTTNLKNYWVVFTFLLVLVSAAAAKYSGGTGTSEDPYRIASPEDLNDIGNHEEDWDWDKYFILVNDINMVDYHGTQFNIIGRKGRLSVDPNNKPFRGVFDGNDHKIYNFTYTSNGYGIGLFGYIRYPAQIKNLGLENVNVSGAREVGGLVGFNLTGSITNCYSSGNVSGGSCGGLVGTNRGGIYKSYSNGTVSGGSQIGGLVGTNYDGSMSLCYSTGTVSGGAHTGGLVGDNFLGVIISCYSTGNVMGRHMVGGLVGRNCDHVIDSYSTGSVIGNSSSSEIGGLVGCNYNINVTGHTIKCYSTGDVSGEYNVGGFIGSNYGTITNCYSEGSVIGNHMAAGGLAAQNVEGLILNCYSSSDISGGPDTYVGGLVGKNGFEEARPGWIYKCFSIGRITGVSNLGGLVGYHIAGEVGDCFWDIETSDCHTSAGGTGKTTIKMKQKTTFTNWDFAETWGIEDNQTYPFLRLTYPVGDIDLDRDVDLVDLAYLAKHWLEDTAP
jgi:hypothetical protein